METNPTNTSASSTQPQINNILLLVEDPNAKRMSISGLSQHAAGDETIFNIVSRNKIKKTLITQDLLDNFTLDNIKKHVLKSEETIRSIYEEEAKNLDEFVVIVVDEPKVNFLLFLLANSDSFPTAYYLDTKALFEGDTIRDALITINPHDPKCLAQMKKMVLLRQYNHASPFSLGSDMWYLSLRIIINLILMEDLQEISIILLKMLKQKYNIILDLSKAFASLCSKMNPKMCVFNTTSSYHNDSTIYTIDRELIDQIFFTGSIPRHVYAPLLCLYPYIAYNSSIIFNKTLYQKFLKEDNVKVVVKVDEKTTDDVSDNEEEETDDDEVMVILKERKLNNPHRFRLDKNFAPYLITSENNPTIKVDIDKGIGEILIDSKIPSQKMNEDIKNMTLALSDQKVTIVQMLEKHKAFVLNMKDVLLGKKINNDPQTELEFFCNEHLYNLSSFKSESDFWSKSR